MLDTDVLEILVAEDDDASLCDQQGELVFLGVTKLRELQSADLGADDGCELGDFDIGVVSRDQVGFLLVGGKTTVVELEWLEGIQVRLLVVDW